MALGLFSVVRNNYNRGYYYFEQQEIGLYVHDNWKVTPRLTLDLGVRWDNWRPYEEKYNRLVNVDLDNFANRFRGHYSQERSHGRPARNSCWGALCV